MLRRLRLISRGALLAAIAVLGFWTAAASGQSGPGLPSLTVPTITLPTLPVTITIPAPPAPPAPLPPPPIGVPPPPVTVPVRVPPPPVASRPPPGPPLPTQAPTQGAPTPRSGTDPQSASGAAADRPRVRLRRLRTARTRAPRGRKGPATRITFWLSGPARVVFLVQSGGPDCSPAGRFTVKGRRGRNEIRFTGKLRDGRLQPGRYRITPIRIRGAQPAGPHTVGVQVLSRGSVPARITTACESPTGPSATGSSLAGEQGAGVTALGPKPPSEQESSSKPERRSRFHGVLGAFKPPDLSLPGDTGSFPWLLGVAALALLALSAGAILAYVLTFVRRAHTP